MQYTLRDLLNIIFRYLRPLVIFWIVTLVAVALFYTQTSKLYDSKARVLVTLGSEAQGRADYINVKNLQVVQREQQLHDEQQILESHDVLITTAHWLNGDTTPGEAAPPVSSDELDRARRFFSGQEPQSTLLLRAMNGFTDMLKKVSKPKSKDEELEDTARQLFDGLAVSVIFDSDALDLVFRYRDPQVAQTVLKLIIGAYYNHHIAVFQSAAESDLLKAQLNRSVGQYHERLGQFSNFKKTHKVYDDEFQANALIEQRGKVQQALNEAVADSDSAAARLAVLKPLSQTLHEFETYSTVDVRNKQRDELTSKLNQMQLEQEAQLSRHPKGSRADKEQQTLVDALHSLIDKEPAQIVEQTEQRRSKASELVEAEIIASTETQRGDQARIERLGHDLNQTDSAMADYTTNLQGFDALQLDLAFAKRESEQMGQAFVDSQLRTLTSESAITDVSVIDLPSLDTHTASPKTSLVAVAALGLLVMGSLAVLLACMGLDTTVADSRSAELRLEAPVMATIPAMRETDFGFADSFSRENHREFARIYQTVRRGTQEGPGGKIILLAESSSREGASLLGYGLARFLSHDVHEKTAFIDCTANSIHESPAAAKGSLNGTVILPWPKDAFTEEGRTGTAAAAIAKLREQYSYIVIAGGALKDATDLLTISDGVSATLLIVEAEKTRRATARHSLDLLRTYGFKNVGLILNKRIFYVPTWLMRFV